MLICPPDVQSSLAVTTVVLQQCASSVGRLSVLRATAARQYLMKRPWVRPRLMQPPVAPEQASFSGVLSRMHQQRTEHRVDPSFNHWLLTAASIVCIEVHHFLISGLL